MKVFRSFLSRLMLSIDDEIRIPPFFPSCSIAQFSTARTRFHHGEELMPLTFPAMASLTVRVRAACRDYCSFMALRQNDGATRFSPVNRTTAFHSFPRHVCPSIRQYLWVTRSHGNLGRVILQSNRSGRSLAIQGANKICPRNRRPLLIRLRAGGRGGADCRVQVNYPEPGRKEGRISPIKRRHGQR